MRDSASLTPPIDTLLDFPSSIRIFQHVMDKNPIVAIALLFLPLTHCSISNPFLSEPLHHMYRLRRIFFAVRSVQLAYDERLELVVDRERHEQPFNEIVENAKNVGGCGKPAKYGQN
ncbi:unnamed protein product [Cylicocyclus nassatus]|uniref:Uncharacterized protein n=1 Tax=Cylicocyclus nassatus TaxID=53992 RepID=A0AA36GUB5_CYLNA|nr:unnamed protein product [Cylicocyclus nassatus]